MGVSTYSLLPIQTAMATISELLGLVPQGVQWALAGIGALYISTKVLGYLQLALNLFVLSGTNVSTRPI